MIHKKKIKNNNHDNNNETDINSSYSNNKSDKVPLVYLHNYENVIGQSVREKLADRLLVLMVFDLTSKRSYQIVSILNSMLFFSFA